MLVYGSTCFFWGVQPKLRSGWSTECTPKSSMLSNPLALATIKSHGTLTSWWTSKPYAILLSFTSWGHGDPIPAVHHHCHYHHYHSFFVAVGATFWIFTLHCKEVIPIEKIKCFECPTQSFWGGQILDKTMLFRKPSSINSQGRAATSNDFMSRVNSSRLHQRCRRRIEFEEIVMLVSFTMSQKCTNQISFPHNGKHGNPPGNHQPTSRPEAPPLHHDDPSSWSLHLSPSLCLLQSKVFFQPGKRWMLSMCRYLEGPMIQWSIMVTSFMSLVGDLKCDSQKSSKSLRRFWRFRFGHGSLSPLSRLQDLQKPPKNTSKTFKKHDPAL